LQVRLLCRPPASINRIVRNRAQTLFRLRLPGAQTARGYSDENHAVPVAGSRVPRAFAVLLLASVTSRNDHRCGGRQRWDGHGSDYRPGRRCDGAPTDRVPAKIYPTFPTSIGWHTLTREKTLVSHAI